MLNIRGYYNRGKIVVNLAYKHGTLYWQVRISGRWGGDGVKGVEWGYRYFSPLQVSLNKRTWYPRNNLSILAISVLFSDFIILLPGLSPR